MAVKSLNQLSIQHTLNTFQKLDPKTKIKIVSAIFGILVFLIFIVGPAWIQRPVIKKEIAGLRSQIQSAERQIQLEPQLLAEQKKYNELVTQTKARLFTEEETQRLLGVIVNMAEKSGMTVLSSQPQLEAEKILEPFNKKYFPLSYLISLEGGYHELVQFISILEGYSKILRVNELSMKTQELKSHSHLGEVRLLAFVLKEEVS